MKCQNENCDGIYKVIDTAEVDGIIYRYRRCPKCSDKKYTQEIAVSANMGKLKLTENRNKYKMNKLLSQ